MTHVLRSTQLTSPVGCGNKLIPKHRGPFQVMDKTDSIYIIGDLVSGKRITTHIHNLRPFIYDPIRTDPLTVAQHNEKEIIVESTAIQRQMVWIRRVQRQLGTVQAPWPNAPTTHYDYDPLVQYYQRTRRTLSKIHSLAYTGKVGDTWYVLNDPSDENGARFCLLFTVQQCFGPTAPWCKLN